MNVNLSIFDLSGSNFGALGRSIFELRLAISSQPFLDVVDRAQMHASCNQIRVEVGDVFHTTKGLVSMLQGQQDEQIRACRCLLSCAEHLCEFHLILKDLVLQLYSEHKNLLREDDLKAVKAARRALLKHRLEGGGLFGFVEGL